MHADRVILHDMAKYYSPFPGVNPYVTTLLLYSKRNGLHVVSLLVSIAVSIIN